MQIVLTKHAILDCIPLRFGKVIDNKYGTIDGVFDQIETNKQKPIEQKNGNEHFIGKLIQNNSVIIEKARFVVGKKLKHELYRPVITIMFENISLASRSVSDLVRSLREDGEIDSHFIVKNFYPLYISGKISSDKDFYKAYVQMGIYSEKKNFDRRLNEIDELRKEEYLKRSIAEKKVLELNKKIIELEKKNDVNYKNEEISSTPIATIKEVIETTRTNKKGEKVRCTILTFKEPLPNRTMDKWADIDGKKTELAKLLINREVITTVWKPKIFDKSIWFNNLYPYYDLDKISRRKSTINDNSLINARMMIEMFDPIGSIYKDKEIILNLALQFFSFSNDKNYSFEALCNDENKTYSALWQNLFLGVPALMVNDLNNGIDIFHIILKKLYIKNRLEYIKWVEFNEKENEKLNIISHFRTLITITVAWFNKNKEGKVKNFIDFAYNVYLNNDKLSISDKNILNYSNDYVNELIWGKN